MSSKPRLIPRGGRLKLDAYPRTVCHGQHVASRGQCLHCAIGRFVSRLPDPVRLSRKYFTNLDAESPESSLFSPFKRLTGPTKQLCPVGGDGLGAPPADA